MVGTKPSPGKIVIDPSQVTLYGTRFCPYCIAARQLLKARNILFVDISVDGDPVLRRELMEFSGRRTVPQIWFGEHHVGGFDELSRLDKDGKLHEFFAAVLEKCSTGSI